MTMAQIEVGDGTARKLAQFDDTDGVIWRGIADAEKSQDVDG